MTASKVVTRPSVVVLCGALCFMDDSPAPDGEPVRQASAARMARPVRRLDVASCLASIAVLTALVARAFARRRPAVA